MKKVLPMIVDEVLKGEVNLKVRAGSSYTWYQ